MGRRRPTKPPRMEGPQFLYPDPIYSFSRKFHDIWDNSVYPDDVERDQKPEVAASVFDKRTRTFRWVGVALWKAEELARLGKNDHNDYPESFTAICEIVTAIHDNTPEWRDFCAIVDKFDESEAGRKATDHAKSFIEDATELREICAGGASDFSKAPWPALRELHRNLLALLQRYPLPSHLYIDGVVHRNLDSLHKDPREQNRRVHSATGTLRKDLDPKDRTGYAYWVDVRMYDDDNTSLPVPRYQSQVMRKGQDPEPEAKDLEAPPHVLEGFSIASKLLASVFPRSYKAVKGGRDDFLAVPIYDAWLDGTSWGSIAGNLVLFFESADEDKKDQMYRMEEFLKRAVDALGRSRFQGLYDRLEALSVELAGSAMSQILSAPISDSLLVNQFAHSIIQLQDWERIIVYRRAGELPRPDSPAYCYSRGPTWQRCHGPRHASDPCQHCPTWPEADSRRYLRWVHDISQPAFLHGCGDAEVREISSVRLAFEYPRTAVLPPDRETKQALDDFYVRQQLEVLRGLAHKLASLRVQKALGVAEARQDFAHEIRHLAHAVGKGWLMTPPRDAGERGQLPAHWKAVPFPELLESAGTLLSLWAGEAADVRTLLDAPTLGELPRKCWDIAFNRISAIVGTAHSLDSPSFPALALYNLKGDLAVLRRGWAPTEWFWVSVEDGEQAWRYAMEHHRVWTRNLCRLLICLFDNMLRHANPNGRPREVRITTEAGPPLTLRIRIEDINLTDEDLELLEDSEAAEDRELAGILTWISQNITSTKQGAAIIQDLVGELGGLAPQYSPAGSASFWLQSRIPFPIEGGRDGAISTERER